MHAVRGALANKRGRHCARFFWLKVPSAGEIKPDEKDKELVCLSVCLLWLLELQDEEALRGQPPPSHSQSTLHLFKQTRKTSSVAISLLESLEPVGCELAIGYRNRQTLVNP